MLTEVVIGATYRSVRSGVEFEVLDLPRHGQACCRRMIYYRNLTPTEDSPPGQTWIMAEDIFLRRFEERGDD